MSTRVSYNKENLFIVETLSNTGDNTGPVELVEWLNAQQDLKLEGQSIVGCQDERWRKIKFRLTGQLAIHYPLLRGLSLFGIRKTVKLTADPTQKEFTLRYEESAEGEAKSYFARLLEIVEKEVRFKQVLGKLIENQQRFQQEEALLITGLRR